MNKMGDTLYGIQNIVNNVTTLYAFIFGAYFLIHINIEPLCGTPECNVVFQPQLNKKIKRRYKETFIFISSFKPKW